MKRKKRKREHKEE
jgi:hypothetical protein